MSITAVIGSQLSLDFFFYFNRNKKSSRKSDGLLHLLVFFLIKQEMSFFMSLQHLLFANELNLIKKNTSSVNSVHRFQQLLLGNSFYTRHGHRRNLSSKSSLQFLARLLLDKFYFFINTSTQCLQDLAIFKPDIFFFLIFIFFLNLLQPSVFCDP